MDEVIDRQPLREYRSVVSDSRRWEHFIHRPGDIFVCTSPKCGTTWMQTIVDALLFPYEHPPGTVIERAPWIDARFFPIEQVVARLEAQPHRRSVKPTRPPMASRGGWMRSTSLWCATGSTRACRS